MAPAKGLNELDEHRVIKDAAVARDADARAVGVILEIQIGVMFWWRFAGNVIG